jgi:hypothetical protein
MKKTAILIVLFVSFFILGCSDGGKETEDIDASVGGCPVEQPTFPDLSCTGNQSCGYGFACCCDTCSTAVICNCVNGIFACSDTGVCDNPWCEDAGVDSGTPVP